jgi:transposase
MKKLASRIEDLLDAGYTPEQLAKKLNVSLATVYRWKATPPKRPMRALVQALKELEKAS